MLDTVIHPVRQGADVPTTSLLERIRRYQRLRRADQAGARLARLDAVADLLERASVRLAAGWTQDAWFVSTDEHGERHHVGVLRAEEGLGSERACLVAAIAIEALPGAVNGPVAQRALGTMWHVLHGDPPAADWSTPPGVNAARARDLVHWNDAHDRRQADVLALLDASRVATTHEASRLRATLATA